MQPIRAAFLPHPRGWAVLARRELCGFEALELQGMSYNKLPMTVKNGVFAQGELITLAGNAFNGYAVAALVTAIMASIELQKVVARSGGAGVAIETPMPAVAGPSTAPRTSDAVVDAVDLMDSQCSNPDCFLQGLQQA